MNKISRINEEYFGKDRSRNYLKDDFAKVLRGTIVRSILVELFVELSKERRNKCELPDGGTAYGDFDPDNAGFFANIFEVYQKGWMIDVRILLGGKKNKVKGGREAGSGGRFVDELTKLTADDFIDYYITPDIVRAPMFLLEKILRKKPKDKIAFIRESRRLIDGLADQLVSKAKDFQSKGYYDKVMKDYEALEFHKDNRPDKHDIREEVADLPYSNGAITIRRPKSKVEIHYIAQCLNDFAEIIRIYQTLDGRDTAFFGSNWPLDVFIDRTLDLYVKEIPEDMKRKIGEDIVKYLHPSIDIVAWEHKEFIKS